MQNRRTVRENVLRYLHLSESIIGHLVHEAVEQSGGTGLVHSELSLWCEVVALLKHTQRGIMAD